MKKILYIHQYFKTPEEGGALRSYFISKALAEKGHKVVMITAHNNPKYKQVNMDGVQVHYLPVPYSNDMTFFQRYRTFFSFALRAILLIRKLPKADLLYATSTPLTVGIVAIWCRRIRKIPYIFEVRDLWPEAPIELGVLSNPATKWLAGKLEIMCYRQAALMVALSPGIAEGILQKTPEASIKIIPNMSDLDFFKTCRREKANESPLEIGYFGAFGMANNLDFILEIATICQNEKLPVKFTLAGSGARWLFIKQQILDLKLENVNLLGTQSRQGIRRLIADVDACIITFAEASVLETNSPNKFFDALAAGKLCIVNKKGWLKELVEQSECGIYIDSPKSFISKINPFLQDVQLLNAWQQHARSLGKNQFSRDKLTARICDIVETLAG